jgi:N-acetylneuraminate lyase
MPPTELLSVLIAAPFTPLRADGAPSLPVVDRPASSLVANNVSGAFACGTTGSVKKVVVEILL